MPPTEARSILESIIDPTLLKPDFSHGLEFNALSLSNDELAD
ncbi:hypothetical protein [Chamaesiphon sp. VAR_69_metabat_338]|nr:hypothetical protein [Chamaesiphon sp. VAR_69_metabat_338]